MQPSLTSAQDDYILLFTANSNVPWVALVVFHECNAIIPLEPPSHLLLLTLIKILGWSYSDVLLFLIQLKMEALQSLEILMRKFSAFLSQGTPLRKDENPSVLPQFFLNRSILTEAFRLGFLEGIR